MSDNADVFIFQGNTARGAQGLHARTTGREGDEYGTVASTRVDWPGGQKEVEKEKEVEEEGGGEGEEG